MRRYRASILHLATHVNKKSCHELSIAYCGKVQMICFHVHVKLRKVGSFLNISVGNLWCVIATSLWPVLPFFTDISARRNYSKSEGSEVKLRRFSQFLKRSNSLAFLAYLLGKRVQTSWWFPQDLNRGPLAHQPRDPVCPPVAAISCPFVCSLGDVIALGAFDCFRPSSLL